MKLKVAKKEKLFTGIYSKLNVNLTTYYSSKLAVLKLSEFHFCIPTLKTFSQNTAQLYIVNTAGADPGGGHTRHAPPLRLEKIWFFGVKSWFFTRNAPKIFVPPSDRRNFFKYAPPPTWNPGSVPVQHSDWMILEYDTKLMLKYFMSMGPVYNCCMQ